MREMAVFRWAKALFDSRSLDADVEDEVRFHLEMRADSHKHTGMSQDDAMNVAKKQFGDIERIKRAMRRARTHPIYAMSAGLTVLTLVIVAVWLYDSSLSSELPALPPGMKFVSGRP